MSGSYYQLNQKFDQLKALILGLPTSFNLTQVLTAGDDAGGLDITNLNNIDLTTINNAAYPPVVAANDLTAVLTAGNTADAPLELVIQDTALGKTTTLFGSGISVELDTGLTLDLTGYGASSIGHSGDSDFAVSTNKNLLVASDNLSISASTLGITSNSIGFTSSPALLINNTNVGVGNTTGVPSIELSKTGRNGAVNDVVGSVFFNAKDSLGVERTFGKIESTITTTIAPLNHDGALDFYSLINGVNQLVLRLNGADNENNSFRPLDMNGNIIKTSLGFLSIDATSSAGTGQIIITPKSSSNINMNGNVLMTTDKTITLKDSSLSPTFPITETLLGNGALVISKGSSAGFSTTTLNTTKMELVNTGVGNTDEILYENTGVGNPFLNITTTNSFTNIQRTTNASTSSIITQEVDLSNSTTKQIGISVAGGLKLINNIDAAPLVINSINLTGLSGGGSIEFEPDNIGGDLIFTGANIESASAGAITTQFLRIKLNGVYYKIGLFNDS